MLTKERKGLVVVNTRNGKGKTTAALGVLFRAWGRGMRVQVFQFLKHTGSRFGESRAAEKLDIPWSALGDGFTWLSKDMDRTRELVCCRFSQTCGVVPKYRASRSAVSAVMPRCPFRIAVMRFTGTASALDNALADASIA